MTAWTRDDLPRPDAIRFVTDDVALDLVVDHLNAHHPKPEQAVCAQSDDDEPMMPRETLRERTASDGRLWNQAYAEGVASAERTCNELRSLIEGQKEHVSKSIEVRNRMRRERDEARAELENARLGRDAAFEASKGFRRDRDAAVARAEAHAKGATRANIDRDKAYEELAEMTNRAEKAEDQWKKWEGQARRAKRERDEAVADLLDAGRVHDEWEARAEQAEQELGELRSKVNAWGRDQPAHAVSREDVKGVIDHWITQGGNHEALLDDLWRWVSGADPAGYVVRESDIAAVDVLRGEGGNWKSRGIGIPNFWTVEQTRGFRDQSAEQWCELEAIARAIEAEQAVDPVEEKARELYEVGNPGTEGMWESIHEAFKDGYRRIARHVLGQEADQ